MGVEDVTPPDKPPGQTPLDPIWHLVFPAFHLALLGYGLAAAAFPVIPVGEAVGYDTTAVFGAILAAACALMLAGDWLSVLRQRPRLLFGSSIVFLVLMVLYFLVLYLSVVHHEVGARPGSTFTPLVFAIFPFFQVLVLARSGRLRRPR